MKKEIAIKQTHWDWLGETLSRHAGAKIAPELVKLIMPGVRLFEWTGTVPIIKENEVGNEMFVIYKGSVRVTRKRKKVADLKKGDFFGEISLVAKAPRTATVKPVKSCQAFEISFRSIAAMDEQFPELMVNLQQVARQRTEELGIKT